MKVGVLALQGAFREHIYSVEAVGAAAVAVRLPSQMDDCDGLIIPGGESTAISKLMDAYGFYDTITKRHAEGMAVWGTCAGAILIAKEVIDGIPEQRGLELMDIVVRRNAYGGQVNSFETDLQFDEFEDCFTGVFIRAPRIERVGTDVRVLASFDGYPVAAAQDDLMVTTFHPELAGDPRIHRYFLESVIGA